MDRKWPILGVLGCCLFLAAGNAAQGQDEANPYAIISERNVFHLNPPPPPAPPPEAPKADLPVIKITGIVKIGDQLRALFVSEPKDKKDTPTFYNLAEGEKQGILEVVKIDQMGEKVDVINSGTKATLTMKEDKLAVNQAPTEGGPQAGAGNPRELRHFPQFPTPGSHHFPAPAFPSARAPFPGGNTPFPVPMRSRRTSYTPQ